MHTWVASIIWLLWIQPYSFNCFLKLRDCYGEDVEGKVNATLDLHWLYVRDEQDRDLDLASEKHDPCSAVPFQRAVLLHYSPL